MNKKLIVVIAALLSVAGSQLIAEGCTKCAMKHGSTKEERAAHTEQKKKNRKARKEAKKSKKQNKSTETE